MKNKSEEESWNTICTHKNTKQSQNKEYNNNYIYKNRFKEKLHIYI